MSDIDKKRFYWLKLNKDFFQQHKIKVLKAMPNGRLYALIYLELLAESTSHNGELRFSESIPYDTTTLAAVIDEDKDVLESAMETFIALELIEIFEDKTIFMSEIQSMIGSESGQVIRKRNALVKNTKHLPEDYQKNTERLPKDYQKNTLEIRDKSIEIRDKNNRGKTDRFIPPTVEQIEEYCSTRQSKVDAQKFHDFYSSKGWMIGKNKMKDWQAAVRTWERKDKKATDELPAYEGFEW